MRKEPCVLLKKRLSPWSTLTFRQNDDDDDDDVEEREEKQRNDENETVEKESRERQ